MNKRRSASQAFATAALLSGQLDGLLAAWEHSIEADRVAGHHDPLSLVPTEPTEAIVTLERELVTLEYEIDLLRGQADAETRRAREWEENAALALREARIDLAKDAARHVEEHRAAAEALTAEVSATTDVADLYRRSLSSIRATHAEERR